MAGKSSRVKPSPNSASHLWLPQGKNKHRILMFRSKEYCFRYNIPYLLDKPGCGHQVGAFKTKLIFIKCCKWKQDNNYGHHHRYQWPGKGWGVPCGRRHVGPARHSGGSSHLLQVHHHHHPTYYRCITIIISPTTGASSPPNLLQVSSIGSMIMISIPKRAPVNKLLLKGEDTRRWLRVGVMVKYFFSHFSIVIKT